MTHIFSSEIAAQYGVNEAIMISNYIKLIEADFLGENYCNGKNWVDSTQGFFSFLFPFWNHKQIQDILESLEKQGVLIKYDDKAHLYSFKNEEEWLSPPLRKPKAKRGA